jgi:hypothetical protein
MGRKHYSGSIFSVLMEESTAEVSKKCAICGKEFESPLHLSKHVKRKIEIS